MKNYLSMAILGLTIFIPHSYGAAKFCDFKIVPPISDCLVYYSTKLDATLAHFNQEWPFAENTNSFGSKDSANRGECGRDWKVMYIKNPTDAPKRKMGAGTRFIFVVDCKGRERAIAEIQTPISCDEPVKFSIIEKNINAPFTKEASPQKRDSH